MKSIPHHAAAWLVAMAWALASGARADASVSARTSEQCIADHVAGQALRLEGRFAAAAAELKQCLHPSCSALLREDCAALLRSVELETPSVVFAASDGRRDLVEVTVRVDDRVVATRLDGRAVALDAGPVVLRFEAPGMRRVTQHLVIRAGQKNRLVAVTLPPAEVAPVAVAVRAAPVRERREALAPQAPRFDRVDRALLGTSLVLGAAGTGLAVGAQRAFDRAEQRCSPRCPRSEVRRIDRVAAAADGVFVVAGAVLLGTVVRIALPRRRTPALVRLGPAQLAAEVAF
jgi:hypothetical protein